jgi:hypothetical protein
MENRAARAIAATRIDVFVVKFDLSQRNQPIEEEMVRGVLDKISEVSNLRLGRYSRQQEGVDHAAFSAIQFFDGGSIVIEMKPKDKAFYFIFSSFFGFQDVFIDSERIERESRSLVPGAIVTARKTSLFF